MRQGNLSQSGIAGFPRDCSRDFSGKNQRRNNAKQFSPARRNSTKAFHVSGVGFDKMRDENARVQNRFHHLRIKETISATGRGSFIGTRNCSIIARSFASHASISTAVGFFFRRGAGGSSASTSRNPRAASFSIGTPRRRASARALRKSEAGKLRTAFMPLSCSPEITLGNQKSFQFSLHPFRI